VFGRPAGHIEGFKYSEAMAEKGKEGLVWDEANLDKYLADPKGYIPKNKMAFPGLKKPEERADVIAFLKQQGGS
jgi:cytochrome c2